MKISNIKFAAIFFGIILLSSISSVFPPTYADWDRDDGYPLEVQVVFESVHFKRADWVWGYYDGMRVAAATGDCGPMTIKGKYGFQTCELPDAKFKLLSIIDYPTHKAHNPTMEKTLKFHFQPEGTIDIIWQRGVPRSVPNLMGTIVYDVLAPGATIFRQVVFETDSLPHFGDCSPLDKISITWFLQNYEIDAEDHKFYYYSDIGTSVILAFLSGATGQAVGGKIAGNLLKGERGLQLLANFKKSLPGAIFKDTPLIAALAKDSSKAIANLVVEKVLSPAREKGLTGTPESEALTDYATAAMFIEPKNWAGGGTITPVDHPQEGIIKYDEHGTTKTELRFKELAPIEDIKNSYRFMFSDIPECVKDQRECSFPYVGRQGFLNLKHTQVYKINNIPATEITYSLAITGTDDICWRQNIADLVDLDNSRPATKKDVVMEVYPEEQPKATRINAAETGIPIVVDIDNKPFITDQGAMMIDLSEKSTSVFITVDQKEYFKYSDYRFDFTDYLGNSIIKNGKENAEAMNNIHKYGTFEIKGTAVPNNSPTKEPVEIYHMAFFNSNLIDDENGFLDDDPFLDDEPILAMIPPWVTDTAGGWADGSIPDRDFLSGIGYMVDEGIIQVSATPSGEKQDSVPTWVKDTAGGWADGSIPDRDFLAGIGYMIEVGIITLES